MPKVRITREEKLMWLRELRERINNYPIIPYFKDEDEMRWSLEHGNIDFIVNTLDYQGKTIGGRAFVRPIKPWCKATLGFLVRALSIDSAIGTINRLIQEHKDHHFIYFRVIAPNIPYPRRSYVDEYLREVSLLESELLRPGEWIERDLYDI